jgi:lysophospholipase L1-like esterase
MRRISALIIFFILHSFLSLSAQTKMLAVINLEESVKMLALGDSYTIGESVHETERWPVQLCAQLKSKGFKTEAPVIIAKTGWRTDQLADAIQKADLKNNFNLVSLLIGVNNQYQGRSVSDYGPEFKTLLETAVKLAGGRRDHVIVLSIPDYGFTPFGIPKKNQISEALDQYNSVNKQITESFGVTYVDITAISRRGLEQPGLVAADGLHPSGEMYSKWVEKILASVLLK